MKRSVKHFMQNRRKAFPHLHPDTKKFPMVQIVRKKAATALKSLRSKHGNKTQFKRMSKG